MTYAQRLSQDHHYSTIIQSLSSLQVQWPSQRLSSQLAILSGKESDLLSTEVLGMVSIMREQVQASVRKEMQQHDELSTFRSPEPNLELSRRRHVSRTQRKSVIYTEHGLMANFFGSITTRYETFGSHSGSDLESDEDQTESRSLFCLRPASWLMRLGFCRGLEVTTQQSIQGWKFSLQPFRAVPNDSEIFKLCYEGDIDGVRALLLAGKASVLDRDSYGCTPLHVSLFLLSYGT